MVRYTKKLRIFRQVEEVKPYIYIACLSFFFFLILPGAGAFYVRGKWRQFRKNILRSTLHPFVSYADIHLPYNGFLGNYRYLGALEALEENTVWIKNEKVTVSAVMDKCQVFLLPSQARVEAEGLFENNLETLPEENPQRISWRSIFSLPEGTTVFISGALFRENGKAVFKEGRDSPLMMVIFDGSKDTILRRSIWGGRQRNEYWNQFTFPSLVVGFFSLLFYAYLLFRSGSMMKLPFVTAVTAALLPLAGFLPPGLFGLFVFRNLWRRARVLRAERDLLMLPIWKMQENEMPVLLSDGTVYHFTVAETDIDSLTGECTSEVKVRSPSFLSKSAGANKERYYLFGLPVPAGDRVYYLPPPDPMADYIITPGNPKNLSERCSGEARKFEYISISAFAAGLLINGFILFSLIYIIVR